MFLFAAFSDPWNGLLEHAIADLAHLPHDGLKFSVIGNRCFEERDLLLGKSDAHRLCFDFACQTPGPRRLGHYTALSDPSQVK